MKKLLLASLGSLMLLGASAQSEKFAKAMITNLKQLDSSKTADAMLSLSASFERIGDAEKNQWLPYYYAALTKVMQGLMSGDLSGNDAIAGKAETLLNKADALKPNNSEISCVRSMIATTRMLVNPQQRWQEYVPVIQKALESAKAQDPNNPRPYYLQAQGLRNTPEQFGGGCKTAVPVLDEAIKRYDTFKPASDLEPNWGKDLAKQMKDGCK
jgi:hypothetical protein